MNAYFDICWHHRCFNYCSEKSMSNEMNVKISKALVSRRVKYSNNKRLRIYNSILFLTFLLFFSPFFFFLILRLQNPKPGHMSLIKRFEAKSFLKLHFYSKVFQHKTLGYFQNKKKKTHFLIFLNLFIF